MAQKRHRNLFREYLDAAARKRATSGLHPLTHADWAAEFNKRRPSGATPVSESAISRCASNKPGIARRIGMDRRWILAQIGIDFDTYLDWWGKGPVDRIRVHGRGKADAEQDSGIPAVAGEDR